MKQRIWELDVARGICKRKVNMSHAVFAVADLDGLYEISVLYTVVFVRFEIFDVVWFHFPLLAPAPQNVRHR